MTHYDLCVIGSGSGNTIADDQFSDWKVALVDDGVGPNHVFGGTCLNVGCIPTKMLVLPADFALAPSEAGRLGVDLTLDAVHWREIRDRVFTRIDAASTGGLEWRESGMANLDLYRGRAQFTGPKTITVGDETITADTFVLAAGSRSMIPDLNGLDAIDYHTSDTIMRVDELPASIIIWGGGFIAAEFAHVLSAFGIEVTVVNRSPRLLRKADRAISDRFTEIVDRRWNLALGESAQRVEKTADGGVRLTTTTADGDTRVHEAAALLVALGRVPNGDTLNLSATGVELDDHGYVVVDEYQRTTCEGMWALGDVSSHWQLKHVANHEARVVQHNVLHPDQLRTADHRFVPAAVFTHPQIASVGLTEQQASAAGHDYVTATQDYGSVAYGWALEDTESFVKLIADRTCGQLLGAHLIGPQASILVQPLIQAMSFELGVRDMARGQYWIHPALTEVIENALLALDIETS